jgi:hypothetical protein
MDLSRGLGDVYKRQAGDSFGAISCPPNCIGSTRFEQLVCDRLSRHRGTYPVLSDFPLVHYKLHLLLCAFIPWKEICYELNLHLVDFHDLKIT